MKRILLFATAVLGAITAFGQGTVNFNNRVISGNLDPQSPQQDVYAPIYGPQAGAPTVELHGQSSVGIPMGSTVYTGGLLSGTGFTVELWGGPDAANLALCTRDGTPSGFARTTFRTGATTMGTTVDNSSIGAAAAVPGVVSAPATRATLQVRAYNNNNGSITSWATAVAQQNASPTDVAHATGTSTPFVVPFQLGGGNVTPPNLVGLTSFNIHTVPEPSAIALGVIGLGSLLFLRRRK